MKSNPYEPVSLPLDERGIWARLLERTMRPTPFRIDPAPTSRGIVDSIVGFTLSIGGFFVAGMIREAIQFLGPMAYPTALLIGLFPVGLWIHYCGVGRRGTARSNALLVLVIMSFCAVQNGINGITTLPLSLLVLVIALPIEWIVGKHVLGMLPGSTYRHPDTEPSVIQESATRSL